jgi:RNA polymerase sigma-70 factor (ECF subfamily)
MLVVAEREQLPVHEARLGNPEAWDALFRRYQLPLYVYVYEMVHDEQASLDIVQESFINATRQIAGLREDHRFGSWLFSIAHQKCIQRWRKQGRDAALQEELAAGAGEDAELGPDDLLLRQEQKEELVARLNQLPPVQRSVLLLHYLEGFSLEEISSITGATLGTVKSRLHYAKKSLRKLIEDSKP